MLSCERNIVHAISLQSVSEWMKLFLLPSSMYIPFCNVITKPLKQVSHRYNFRTEPAFIFNQLRSTLEAPLNLVTKLWWLWISSTEFFQRSVSRKHILRREHNFLDNWISMNGSIRSTSLKLSTSHKLNNKYKVKLLRTRISHFWQTLNI